MENKNGVSASLWAFLDRFIKPRSALDYPLAAFLLQGAHQSARIDFRAYIHSLSEASQGNLLANSNEL